MDSEKKFIPFAIIPNKPKEVNKFVDDYKGQPDLPIEPVTHFEEVYLNTFGMPK